MYSNTQLKINNHMPCYIIAEIGVNHNGSIEMAFEMIDKAVETGVNAVKFQTFQSNKLVSKFTQKADYQKRNTNNNESQLEMLRKLELTFDEYKELQSYCSERNIDFLSTPFDIESAKFLKSIGVSAFKIGSGDLTNIPLLKEINDLKLPVILSTGMSNLTEIELALHTLCSVEVYLLHCTSNYPAPYYEVNLKAIDTINKAFNKIVGYSDHTEGIEVSVAAVALGAKIIEKHFTLDRSLPGPDHKMSSTPDELRTLVNAIRNIEEAMGNGVKRCMPSEMNTRNIARKSIVLAKDVFKGQQIDKSMLTIKRPGTGIEPKFFDQLIGKTIKENVKVDNVLKWEHLL